MGNITIVMKIGFVWAIISFLIGCAQTQESMYPKIESQIKKIESQNKKIAYQSKKIAYQNKKIEQLTAKLIKSRQANLALKRENKKLKTEKLGLINTNSKIKKYNQELAMKIDMLKTLDHRVEEKRKNYSSD